MIGRKQEITELNNLYNSGKPEFIAVYGRRRVGKTFLIDETFKNKFTFRHAGLSPIEYNKSNALEEQLSHFYLSLKYYGLKNEKKPKSWLEAFYLLVKLLDDKRDGERQVVFIDELPWLDTNRSGFITALEGFWNNWGCHRDDLVLIVCGSATSWMMNELIGNHGGLYGRITYEIKLVPFTLNECEQYLKEKNIAYSRYDIVQSYMMLGGIPYYMEYLMRGNSLPLDIDRLFFSKNAKLHDEFNRLFASTFDNPDLAKTIVKLLSTRNYGYKRSEISDKLKTKDGKKLATALNALIASDFIIKYIPFGHKKNDIFYKLIDPFCIFYLYFVDNKTSLDTDFWQQNIKSQSVISWRGIAFENVCFNHIKQIKKALGISGVTTRESAWQKKSEDKDDDGMQIDLIISRNDNVINMCEVKFYSGEFSVNKSYYTKLMNRQTALSNIVSPIISIHNTLITTIGLKYNEYSGIFSNVITLDDLFE